MHQAWLRASQLLYIAIDDHFMEPMINKNITSGWISANCYKIIRCGWGPVNCYTLLLMIIIQSQWPIKIWPLGEIKSIVLFCQHILRGFYTIHFFAWEMGMLRCKPANQLSAKLKLFFSSDVDTPLSPSNLSAHYYVVDKRGFERSSAAPAS